MISIFAKESEDETRRRDQYLNRLKEPVHSVPTNTAPPGRVFYLDGPAGEEPAVSAAQEPQQASGSPGKPEPRVPADTAAELTSLASLAASVETERSPNATPAEAAQPAAEDAVRRMADKMGRQLAEAFSSMMCEMQSISMQGSAGIQGTVEAMAAETERLNAGLKAIRQDVDEAMSRSRSSAASESRTAEALKALAGSVEHSSRLVDAHSEAVSTQGLEIQQLRQEVKQQGEAGAAEIRTRLDPMEQKLRDLYKEANQAQASVSAMDERFAALERRLDSQAEAIKALHAATQGFGARQEILQDLLQKMIGGDRAVQPLPDSL